MMMTLFLLTSLCCYLFKIYVKENPKRSFFLSPRELLRKKIEGTWRLQNSGDSQRKCRFELINVRKRTNGVAD